MKKGNLLQRRRRTPQGLTRADRNAQKAPNLLKRNFKAEKPNQKWLTDITQVQCSDGKLYIAPVFDCFSGKIISLVMDSNMKKELCVKAINVLKLPYASFNLLEGEVKSRRLFTYLRGS